MVYEKKRSGDPDLDDKQPPEHHAGNVVSAGDGVHLSPVTGPVDAEGAHVNLAVDTLDQDNRPAPGEHATQSSDVQDYDASDLAVTDENGVVEADKADVQKIADAQAAVQNAA